MSLINQTRKILEKPRERDKKKDTFWASESETMLFEIYHRWKGTEATNPIRAEAQVLMNAGKMMEEALVEQWTAAGMVQKHEDQIRIRMDRLGVPISGYIDALHVDGYPIEVKTFYGYHQIKELEKGKARESYLKQLAIYMDALNQDKGKLFYMERGNGRMFEFTLHRVNEKEFLCGDIGFNLHKTYERWQDLYTNYILPSQEPEPDYLYKIPPSQVDWSKVPKADIKKARANQKVIGDHAWAVNYSGYKDLILQRQGVEPGYTIEELLEVKKYSEAFK
tara:strand:+ start:1425 stop:2261 length:837 start_codon:yes stop_codon:yes gene_type:complete